MTDLTLSLAMGNYDRTRAIVDGRVKIDGVDPVPMLLSPEEMFFRAFRHQAFDISELSLSSYSISVARGDPHYVGLGGLEIIGSDGRPILSSVVKSLSANPRDLNSTPGYEGDLRRLENLLSGSQGSCDDTKMWLAPFAGGMHGRNGTNVVELEFKEPVEVGGLRVWNYNKDWDSSFRGARLVRIEADGVPIQSSRTFVLRKVGPLLPLLLFTHPMVDLVHVSDVTLDTARLCCRLAVFQT